MRPAGLALLSVLCGQAAALKPSLPVVDQVFPHSATIGETVQVTVEGNFLDGARALQLDPGSLRGEVLESGFLRVKLRLTSEAAARPGLHAIRLLTRRGITNAFHFRLTRWRSVPESEPNDRREQATQVAAPISVNAVIDNYNDTDFYRFRARAGETLAFNLLAGRNGYATGHEIGHFSLVLMDAADKPLHTQLSRFLMDPYFQWKFSAEGDYYLAVNHSRMAVTCLENECENRRTFAAYQLAIGTSPVLWSIWPPVVKSGSTTEIGIKADFLNSPLSVSGDGVTLSAVAPGRYRLEVAKDAARGMRLIRADDSSGLLFPLALEITAEDVQVEKEPNDTRDQSPLIKPPSLILGRMNKGRDIDSFHFTPTGAEALSLRLTSRILGSDLNDPNLHILCKEGDMAASNDEDSSLRNPRSRDPFLEFKGAGSPCPTPEEGYYAQVRDLSMQPGESPFYLLSIARQAPGFDIAIRPERILLQRGMTNDIAVTARRYGGFNDEIQVAVENLPPGVEAAPLAIRSGQTTGVLKLTAASDAAGNSWPIRVTGAATIGGAKETRATVQPQPMLGDGPGFVQVAEQPLYLSVGPATRFAVERVPPAGAGFVTDRHKILPGASLKVVARLERSKGFTSEIEWSVEGLPGEITVERIHTVGDSTELDFRAASTIAAGEHRITLIASADGLREALKGFFLRVEK
ncbi:MAG: hypothetical protein FJW39_17675 [Acidobacteria bacterium]|nr:hypothetical protein [Acidobacteriota bacterium]